MPLKFLDWQRPFQFSAGFYVLLLAVSLTLWGRYLPWPLKMARYLLVPYRAFAAFLMRLTGFDAFDKFSDLGPHGRVLAAYMVGPAAALYFIASLVIVSYVIGIAGTVAYRLRRSTQSVPRA